MKMKKAKGTKKCVIKQNLTFKRKYKNFLKANQLENEINHKEKIIMKYYLLLENHSEFIKNNRLI